MVAIVGEREPAERRARPFLAEGAGMLIALLDGGVLEPRRKMIVNRLRRLRDTDDDFAALPEDLRDRIREIIAEAEH